MKRALCSLILIFSAMVVNPQQILKPSGVWSTPGVNMNSMREYSWGMNPVSIGVYAIDLGAKKPWMHFDDGFFEIHEVVQDGYVFLFKGLWFGEDIPGTVSVILGSDGDSLYFLDLTPERFHYYIEFHVPFWFVRVPVDAPIVEIGSEGP